MIVENAELFDDAVDVVDDDEQDEEQEVAGGVGDECKAIGSTTLLCRLVLKSDDLPHKSNNK
jgi:hypothetical protein